MYSHVQIKKKLLWIRSLRGRFVGRGSLEVSGNFSGCLMESAEVRKDSYATLSIVFAQSCPEVGGGRGVPSL